MDRRLRRPRRTEDYSAMAEPAATQTKRSGPTAAPTMRTRASPSRTKVPEPEPPQLEPGLGPRTRRSSRPRSAAGQPTVMLTKTAIKVPTPVKEVIEFSSPVRNSSSLPTTLTTNTSTRAPNQRTLTSSVNSANANTSRTYSSTTTTTQRIEIRSEGDDVDTDSIRKRLSERLRRSLSKTISNMAGTSTTNTEDAGSRYSRSVSRSVYDDDEKSSKRSYSTDVEFIAEENEPLDDEEEEFRSFNATRQSVTPVGGNACRKLKPPSEFGGWPGALLLLVLSPALVYYLTWSCTARNACQFKRANLTALLDWQYLSRQVFQPHVVGVFAAYQCVVFLLVALLPGRRVHLTRETYKFNGLIVCLTLLIAGGIAEYLKFPVANFVMRHYLRFCIYGLLSAFVAACWSYWRVDTTKYNVLRQTLSNDYGRTGNFVVDFALGRQLNPKWLGRVDLKQYYYRLSLVSTLLYAVCYLYQILQWPQYPQAQEGYLYLLRYYYNNVNYDAGTLLAASSLLLYVLDALLFEHHLSSSFELQHDGYGALLLLRYAATPYLLSAVSKYFYEQRVPISCCFAPYGALLLLLLGLFIKRYSCAYKYKYRLNSQSPLFANIETIHTYQGSRLLLSGLWGSLRQPNYLGDILALCGLAAPMFLRLAWPPLLSLLLLVLLLLHRATRANARNQGRYHSSWHRYCSQVRYYVLPKVY
ncbi:LBR [Drosophila busckii]|uniref:LBR n=1 Tax=Drosophila busckii TaxID=30019 RepID=A0A0M4EVJ0_DROBS|nr:lamin-B receptor [Drosophila busckii]ALC41645.1 LBR [Drosophila busckii]